MAVDKSYGSGKSRSAANSSARRRVAAGQMTKSKKSPAEKIKAGRAKMAASPLGQLADTVLGFALPTGKVLKAAKALRAAGDIARADSLTARVVAKAAGGSKAAARGQREQKVVAFMRPDYPGIFQGPVDSVRVGSKARGLSESVFPRATKPNVSEGTLNIVDTRRMNPAQAKSALEKGVNQTATYKLGVPSAPKKVNKVTKRLLGGR